MRKFAGGFFLSLLILTLVSWKLDGLRTPQVVCAVSGSGQLPNEAGVLESYQCVPPLEALSGEGKSRTVYLVEETNSFFSPLVARQVSVTVQSQTETQAAVSGLLAGVRVVQYTSRSLAGETVPVRAWEETGR